MDARSPRSKCQEGRFLLRAVREKPSHDSLLASGGLLDNLWHSLANGSITPSLPSSTHRVLLACLSVSKFLPFYKDTSHTELGVNPSPVRPHLNSLRLQWPSTQIRSHSDILGGLRLHPMNFEGRNSIHNTYISGSSWLRFLQGKMEALVQLHTEIGAQSSLSWLGLLSVPRAAATVMHHHHARCMFLACFWRPWSVPGSGRSHWQPFILWENLNGSKEDFTAKGAPGTPANEWQTTQVIQGPSGPQNLQSPWKGSPGQAAETFQWKFRNILTLYKPAWCTAGLHSESTTWAQTPALLLSGLDSNSTYTLELSWG